MYDLTVLRERLRTQRPVPWDQLPDFSLYMDQVLSYMDRQVIRFDEDDGLTAAMVNNYTKSGLVPRADGKNTAGTIWRISPPSVCSSGSCLPGTWTF